MYSKKEYKYSTSKCLCMKFTSNSLTKISNGKTVFLLMERENKNTQIWSPVGVVDSMSVSSSFYSKDPDHRDVYQFILNELPEETGVPADPYTPPPDWEVTRQQVEDATQKTQQFLKKIREQRDMK